MAYFLKNKKLVIISLIIIFLASGFAFLMVLGRQTDRNFVFNNEETGLISVPNSELQPDQVNNFQVFQFPKTPLYNEGNLTGDFIKGVVNDIVEKNPYGSLPQGGYDSALLIGNPVETFHSVVSDYYKEVVNRRNLYLSQLKTSREKDSGSQLKYLNNIFLSNTRAGLLSS